LPRVGARYEAEHAMQLPPEAPATDIDAAHCLQRMRDLYAEVDGMADYAVAHPELKSPPERQEAPKP
jgi:hypothetical protein